MTDHTRRLTPTAVLMVLSSDGARTKVFPIHCGKCRVRDGMNATRFRSAVPWRVYEHHFIQRGWELGRVTEEDRCPRCIAIETKERRSKRNKKTDNVIPLAAPDPSPMPSGTPQPYVQVGPTYQELKRLQRKFAKPAEQSSELDLLRARVKRLEQEMAGIRAMLTPVASAPSRSARLRP